MRHILPALLTCALLAGCTTYSDTFEEYRPPRQEVVHAIPEWPALADARIRPGVQVLTPLPGGGVGQCTANFLFASADNKTLYLGIAAHCFGSPDDPAPVGTSVTVAGINNAGEVAWNLWERDPSARADFALVALDNRPEVRSLVHPAVLHYGGPTGLAQASEVTAGSYVVSYGHSSQRAPYDEENPREGFVFAREDGDYWVWTDNPGIQGDSGSGLMTSGGLAVGVLSRGTTNPTDGSVPNRDFPSVNFYVELDTLLPEAMRDPGLEGLRLVTWQLLQGGRLPL